MYYPKDVLRIMGKQYLQARLYLAKVKKHYNKKPHQFISIEEFCEYSGLKIDHLLRCIVGLGNIERTRSVALTNYITCTITSLKNGLPFLVFCRIILKLVVDLGGLLSATDAKSRP